MKYNRLIVGILVAGFFWAPVTPLTKSSTDIGSTFAEEQLSANSDPAKLKAKLAEIDKRINESPSAKLYGARANVLVFQEKFPQALNSINEAIRLGPLNGKFYAYRGLIYSALGNTDETIKNIEKAKSLNYTDPDYLGILALAQTDKRMYDEASKNAEAALKEEHDNDLALHARGRVNVFKKNFLGAIQDFTQVIKSNAKLPGVYSERAYAWEMLGNKQKAAFDKNYAQKLRQHKQ